VTQIVIEKKLRLEKPQNMCKTKEIMQMVNKTIEGILDGKDINITELNHLIYAAATVITEEINGTGEYKLETWRSKTTPGFRWIQESINIIKNSQLLWR